MPPQRKNTSKTNSRTASSGKAYALPNFSPEEMTAVSWVENRDYATKQRFEAMLKPKKFVVEKKTVNHEKYYDALRAYQIIAVDGPAGTLKTLLACEAAAEALLSGNVDRIVVTRPMIPVGNTSRIGFLPGSLEEKCMVYLSHIISMFKTLLPETPLQDFLVDKARLVFAPIDYLRGTTFDRQFVLADEMQNCTSEEISMLMNRMGECSQLVINGSSEQVDIHNSGFVDALKRLDREPSNDFIVIEMQECDIVRNKLMKELARRWKKDYLTRTELVYSEDRFDADFCDGGLPSYGQFSEL